MTQLEIENDRTEITYRNNLAMSAAARKQLAAAVGIPEMEIDRLQFDLTIPLPTYEHEALRQGVVDQNAPAAIAAVEIRKTQVQFRRAVVEPRPNFNIQAGYQYSVEGPHNDQWYAQLAMSVPLWNRNQGGIRAAQAETFRAAALQRVKNDLSGQAAKNTPQLRFGGRACRHLRKSPTSKRARCFESISRYSSSVRRIFSGCCRHSAR